MEILWKYKMKNIIMIQQNNIPVDISNFKFYLMKLHIEDIWIYFISILKQKKLKIIFQKIGSKNEYLNI